MTSNTSLVISGLLLVFTVAFVQSVPIEKANTVEEALLADHKPSDRQPIVPVKPAPASPSSTTTSTSSSPSASDSKPKDGKTKRNIQLDELFDDSAESDEADSHFQLDNRPQPIEHVLHPKMQETPVTVHDQADKPVDTDDSSAFSDARMTPDELTDIVRRRRDVKLSGDANRRRKRALTSYDLYDTNPFYDAYTDLLDGYEHARSARSFAPIYWYPSVNERNIRAALTSSYYGASAWPRLYASDPIDDDNGGDVDDDNSLVTIYREDDGDDDVNDYELNRYPILLQTANQPFDNLQLQQRYNTDDLPVDEDFEDSVNYDLDSYGEADLDDDDTERYRSFLNKQHPYYARYEPVQAYFE